MMLSDKKITRENAKDIIKQFAKEYRKELGMDTINCLGVNEMWNDASPIWLRPQYSNVKMYKPRKMLQVVGHTPVEKIYRDRNIISCDAFSTYRNGKAIGTEEFLILDTLTWECNRVKL